ncbi:MAG: PTS sugar transporter subunit IIC [Frisingicoccus sp.]
MTILTGGAVPLSPISRFMSWLGGIINWGTEQQPIVMGIVVSVVMGMVLTLPISSAALGIILGLNGVAAGAATIGCCCQMVGFAVTSYRDNGFGGLLSQGLGTSMLRCRILREALIWVPPTSSAILDRCHIAVSYGGAQVPVWDWVWWADLTYQTMAATESPVLVLIKIMIFHFLLPAVVTMGIAQGMRKMGYIRNGDMKLHV